VVLWNLVAVDQVRIVNEKLLDATSEQVDVPEPFLGEDLGHLSSMTLVIIKDYYHFVVKVLEAEQGPKVVLAIHPPMGEGNGTHDMEIVKIFVRICTFTASVQYNDVLSGQVKETLQSLSVLVRSIRQNLAIVGP
jgi:hypothetical protein